MVPGPLSCFLESCRPRFRPLRVLGEGGFGRVIVLFGGQSFERARGDTREFDGVARSCKAGR